MSRVASQLEKVQELCSLGNSPPSLGPKGPPTRFTYLSDRHTEEGEKGPPADPLPTLAGVGQPQPCGLLPGKAPRSPSCAPPSNYSATPSRPMRLQAWNSSPTSGAQPLPHSLWKLCVPCTDFLLTALDLAWFQLPLQAPPLPDLC